MPPDPGPEYPVLSNAGMNDGTAAVMFRHGAGQILSGNDRGSLSRTGTVAFAHCGSRESCGIMIMLISERKAVGKRIRRGTQGMGVRKQPAQEHHTEEGDVR